MSINRKKLSKKYRQLVTYKRHKNFYDMLSGILIFVTFTGIWWLVFQLADRNLVGGYWTNVITTVGGTVLIIFVLDKWNGNRAIEQRKQELIMQMGSPDNAFAVEAVRLLRQKGWLEDGSLTNSMLHEGNLEGAEISRANLQGVNLFGANLQNAHLYGTNLQSAILVRANLQGGHLGDTNLQDANLSSAKLQKAYFLDANLQGAILVRANLQGAFLDQSKFSLQTTLPDNSKWSPDRDMLEFTDSKHPNFWREPTWLILSDKAMHPPPTFESIERPPRPRWRDMR